MSAKARAETTEDANAIFSGDGTIFRLAKPAFFRYNGKFGLQAFMRRKFRKLLNLDLRTGIELQTKL